MQKVADAADISVLFFSAGANIGPFWVILGQFFGNFGSFLGQFGQFWVIFGMLYPKISTSQEKLAPTGWHGRHVFATLLMDTPHILDRFIVLSINLCLKRQTRREAQNQRSRIREEGSDPFFLFL